VRRAEGLPPPPPPPVRANSFLAAPGDLFGDGGEERAQWKSTDLGRRRCRRHHHRVIYLAVVLIPHTLPAAQTTWAASTTSRCAPRWDFDLVAFHGPPPPLYIIIIVYIRCAILATARFPAYIISYYPLYYYICHQRQPAAYNQPDKMSRAGFAVYGVQSAHIICMFGGVYNTNYVY